MLQLLQLCRLVDVMPEDKQAKAYEELETQLERQADREQQ
jgi:hypothetical protein